MAAGAQRVDAFEAGDLVLDDLRDLRFDDRRGGAAVDGLDADDRRLDVRRLADRQAARGHQADDREQQAHDHREDGPADGDVGENHVAIRSRRCARPSAASASLPCTRTGTPSRRFSVPSMTTPSSAVRPCRTSTSPGPAAADLDLALVRLAVRHDVHEVLLVLGHDRLLRQHQRLAFRRAPACTRHEHAGPQTTVAVVDQRADRDRARRRIDARIDARDAAVERRVRSTPCCAPGPSGPAAAWRGRLFGHGEVELDDAEVVERRDDGARIRPARRGSRCAARRVR